MSTTMKTLGIDRLPMSEQYALVHEIWNNIAASQSPSGLTESQREELRRRIKEDDENPDDVIPWEHVRQELRALVGL